MKARSRPLTEVYDGPLDLNDVAAGDGVLFVRDGVGLAGRGVVARVTPADARRSPRQHHPRRSRPNFPAWGRWRSEACRSGQAIPPR